MADVDYLLTLAEVAATFAGLAAIITVLRGPRRRQWNPREVVGLWGLLAPSLACFLLALAPHPFLAVGVREDMVWATCSAVLAIGWLAGGWGAIGALRRAASEGFPDPTPFSNPSLLVLGSLALGLAAVNTTGVFGDASSAVFALSLLCSLAFSFVIFVTFLYASTSATRHAQDVVRSDAPAAPDAKDEVTPPA